VNLTSIHAYNVATTNLPAILTLSGPVVSNGYISKHSGLYWSNPPFLISDIWALWHSELNARVPECQK